MIKDDSGIDPEEELRRRLMGQQDPGATTPEGPDPYAALPKNDVYTPPPAPPPMETRQTSEPNPTPQPPPPTPQPTPAPPTPTPQPTPAPTPAPAPAPLPGGTVNPDGSQPGTSTQSPHANWIAEVFKKQGKTPTAADIAYWENVITRANGDLGYVQMRMLQPDGPPEGTPAPNSAATLNYQQQLAYIQSKLGRAITPAEMTAVRAKFGGTAADSTSPAIMDQVVAFLKGGGGGAGGPGGPTTLGQQDDPNGPGYTGPAGYGGYGVGTTGTGTSTGTGTGTGSGPQGLWGPDFIAQMRKLLMERLQGISGPVDANSPNIASAMTAAQDAASRQTDKERNQLAEHLYATGGLNTDAISQQIQRSGETNAVGLGSLRANLMQKEVDGRRSELQNLLNMALQSGDAEMTNAIRLQLAALDAQVRREGYGVDMAKYQAYLNSLTGTNLTGA